MIADINAIKINLFENLCFEPFFFYRVRGDYLVTFAYNQPSNRPRKIIMAAIGNFKTEEIKTIDPCDRYQSLPGNGGF